MGSREVAEVLRMLEYSSKIELNRENMFESAGKVYCALRTMVAAHKKQHEYYFIQKRVYALEIRQEELQQSHKLAQANRDSTVSAAVLCSHHTVSEQEICRLILLRYYLYGAKRKELLDYIVAQIRKLTHVGAVLVCFKHVIRSKECLNDPKLYGNIQEKFIQKILSIALKPKDFAAIAHFILTLPFINSYILSLISRIFQHASHLHYFSLLYLIFKNNFPTYPNEAEISSLLRITTTYTIPEIRQMLKKEETTKREVKDVKEKDGKFIAKGSNVRVLVESEAQNKLRQHIERANEVGKYHSMERILEDGMEYEGERGLTDKVECEFDFIVVAMMESCSLWADLAKWEKTVPSEWVTCLGRKVEVVLVYLIASDFERVLKVVAGMLYCREQSYTGLLFLRELLRLEDCNQLNHSIVRRFLATRILESESEELTRLLFSELRLVYIVLYMFCYEYSCIRFYRGVVANYKLFRVFRVYLMGLAASYPVKFKEFFLKVDQTAQGEILNSPNYPLIKLFGETMSIELAAGVVQELSLRTPSRFVAAFFLKLLLVFKDHALVGVLRAQVIRCLNIMLVRVPPSQLNDHFKTDLPKLIQAHLVNYQEKVFKHVSPETLDALKKAHYKDIRKDFPVFY